MSKDAALSDPQIPDLVHNVFDAATNQAISEIAPLLDTAKSVRAKQLLQEIATLRAQALTHADPDDQALYLEMAQDKLGSLTAILDTERIVKERAAIASVKRVFLAALENAGIVATHIIKVGVKSVLTGATGGLAGPLAGLLESAVESALDTAAEDMIKTVKVKAQPESTAPDKTEA